MKKEKKGKLIQRNNKTLKKDYLRSGSEGQTKTLIVIKKRDIPNKTTTKDDFITDDSL